MTSKHRASTIRAKDLLRVPPTVDTSKRTVYRAAKAYIRSGLSLIPIRADGTKMPAFELLPRVWDDRRERFTRPWSGYRQCRPTTSELHDWFLEGWYDYGIAILGGAISGSLEIIDLDNWAVVSPWLKLVEQRAPGLLSKLVLVRTPRPGLHIYYRCPTIEPNQKLARVPDPAHDGKKPKTVIETKSEGGYCLAPPSPAACHPSGRLYTLVSTANFTEIPTIAPELREVLLDCARTLDEWEPPKRTPRRPRPQRVGRSRVRPGDDFNARAEWAQILEPHGWVCQGLGSGEADYWCRPGKDMGASATTNYEGSGLLYVFSSNAAPFEEGKGYTKFHAYALLEHNGDFGTAARRLARLGYGWGSAGKLLSAIGCSNRYSSYPRLSLRSAHTGRTSGQVS